MMMIYIRNKGTFNEVSFYIFIVIFCSQKIYNNFSKLTWQVLKMGIIYNKLAVKWKEC